MRRLVLLFAFVVALSCAAAGMSTTRGKNGLIAYSLEVGSDATQLFTIRPDGSGAKRMGRGLSVANPDWSPDGQTIVVEISRSNSAGINLMTAAGSVINGVRAPAPTPHSA